MDLPPFQTLIDAHAHDVHRFLTAMVGVEAADDCYQETWVAALRVYPRLHDAGNLRGWLLTIARRKAIDHIRARRRAAALSAALPQPDGSTPPDARADSVGSQLWPAVRSLPTKQRMAVAMRYVLDADYPTIATTMGISTAAARRNVYEGLRRLRKEYDRE